MKNWFAYFFLLILDLLDHAMSHFSMGSFTAELFLWGTWYKKCNYCSIATKVWIIFSSKVCMLRSIYHVLIRNILIFSSSFHHIGCEILIFAILHVLWRFLSLFYNMLWLGGKFNFYYGWGGGKFVENSFLTFRVKNL